MMEVTDSRIKLAMNAYCDVDFSIGTSVEVQQYDRMKAALAAVFDSIESGLSTVNLDNHIKYTHDCKGKWQSWEAIFAYSSNTGNIINTITAIEWGKNKEEARENLINALIPFAELLSPLIKKQQIAPSSDNSAYTWNTPENIRKMTQGTACLNPDSNAKEPLYKNKIPAGTFKKAGDTFGVTVNGVMVKPPQPEPDNNEWIAFDGDAMPVIGDTEVQLKLKDKATGDIRIHPIDGYIKASTVYWFKDNEAHSDILAYRIIKEEPKEDVPTLIEFHKKKWPQYQISSDSFFTLDGNTTSEYLDKYMARKE